MLTASEIKSGLVQFYGTENYHRWSPLFSGHLLTDGVNWLCENADCFWLVDAIASYHAEAMKDEMMRDMQFWTLKVKDGKATLIGERDTGNVAFTQEIPFTDFPLDEIKIWVSRADPTNMVLMLCGEY